MSTNKPAISLQAYLRSGAVQKTIADSIGGDNAGNFTTSLLSVVNTNPVLQDCPPESVIKAAITAAAMKLPIDPNLGFAYIIPYNNKKKVKKTIQKPDGSSFETTTETWVTEAQFQLGYKGFIQLAQRSGQFQRINATDVREGEYQGIDRRSGELNIVWEEDDAKREKSKVIGYLGYFRLLNGFEKELYMSVDELNKHGKKYSKSFAKGYGLWKDQFDVMAKKTVLKLLISKYGALSTSLQEAIKADQASVEEDGYKYIDNDDKKPETPSKNAPIEGEVVEPPAEKTPAPAKPATPAAPAKSTKEILDEKFKAREARVAAEKKAEAK